MIKVILAINIFDTFSILPVDLTLDLRKDREDSTLNHIRSFYKTVNKDDPVFIL